jgi:hypothetical protein
MQRSHRLHVRQTHGQSEPTETHRLASFGADQREPHREASVAAVFSQEIFAN